MSQSEAQMWALLAGFFILGSIVYVLYSRRRTLERAGLAGPPRSEFDRAPPKPSDLQPEPAIAERATAATAPAATAPSRHTPSPDSLQEVEALAMGIRSLVSRTVSERVPLGWSALILCPPAHPHQMTWHVHLAPRIALDLNDGRTVPASAPEPTHAWQLPGGRTVQVSDGDPDPAPTVETTNVRVTGPYFTVSMTCEAGQEAQIVARVLGDGADDLPQPRASAHDVRAVQGALRSAVELAVSSKMLGAAPVVGYRPASWAAHERVWLTVEQ
ncbi:MAG: hypothetical protein U0893_23600 [Chloroflexota bacterium]